MTIKNSHEITEAARSLIADSGFDPLYGARPLKRTLQCMVGKPDLFGPPAPRV